MKRKGLFCTERLEVADQYQHAEDDILIDKCGIHGGKRVARASNKIALRSV